MKNTRNKGNRTPKPHNTRIRKNRMHEKKVNRRAEVQAKLEAEAKALVKAEINTGDGGQNNGEGESAQE